MNKEFYISIILVWFGVIMITVTFFTLYKIPTNNYTVYELCPNGNTASKEISADGTKIIKLNCESYEVYKI